jgi:hypothetical protein
MDSTYRKLMKVIAEGNDFQATFCPQEVLVL